MFKYLSDILSKFTPQQRILALGLLLLTAVLLGLGNSLIDAYSKSDSILSDRVRRLELSQSILLKENDSLYNSISNSQIQCARDIMDVRTKILEDLGILERAITSQSNRIKLHNINQLQLPDDQKSRTPASVINDDTTLLMSSQPQPIQVIQIEDNSDIMLTEIKKLKDKIKKDIE